MHEPQLMILLKIIYRDHINIRFLRVYPPGILVHELIFTHDKRKKEVKKQRLGSK